VKTQKHVLLLRILSTIETTPGFFDLKCENTPKITRFIDLDYDLTNLKCEKTPKISRFIDLDYENNRNLVSRVRTHIRK
jgi:hypothetical protein